MSERDKGNHYMCPKCDRHGLAWDGRAKVWMCHWVSCSHTEKHVDPAEDQLQTLFKVLRYLVANTTTLCDQGHETQEQLVKELGEIIKLGE